MTLDANNSYKALEARDPRFDGVFFVGVKTTGIYCRPICPARVPKRDRCEFFARAAEAERAGFRACFRCRPELAPGFAPVDAVPRLVGAATKAIDAGFLDTASVADLAQAMNVSPRHLLRAMEDKIGVTPVEYAQTRRLAMAKQLLHDANLSLIDVANASGFGSVRRFNALFRDRFGCAPSAVRKSAASARTAADTITLRLDYREPLAWSALLDFLRARAIPGVEDVTADAYRRVVSLGGRTGTIAVARAARPGALALTISLSLLPCLREVVSRTRAMFDLDARPHEIEALLGRDRQLRKAIAKQRGARVPGAFDPFELAVRAVLGQQISVRGATTLAGRLAHAFGKPLAGASADGALTTVFPDAATLAGARVQHIARIGLPAARARTIAELARATHDGRVNFSVTGDPSATKDALLALPGIGPWTVEYLSMRALRWPDAFPSGDLVIKRALDAPTARAAEEKSAPWKPWRAYAVILLWSSMTKAAPERRRMK